MFAFKGAYDFWKYYDYDTHLTQKQLISIDNEDMTVVFYKKSCLYCKAGKQAVIEAGKSSDLPVFYVDVETVEGQELVSRCGIQRPATVLKIRSGLVKSYFYAEKVNGEIVPDKKAIKEAFGK
ncbi:thioredoxin [Streptococcus ferus]|uniref:thioredoxin n=1 Tax=Streptococcus ferus TaxID=1345 RepID=UPI00351725A6